MRAPLPRCGARHPHPKPPTRASTLKSFIDILASIPHTPALKRIWWLVASLALYAAVVVAIEYTVLRDMLEIRTNVHEFIGIVLGLMLVFRTNTAYDRWWEARKQWGQLTNEMRNLTLKAVALVRTTPAETARLVDLLVAFELALKDHLRGGATLAELPGFTHDRARPVHVPAYVAERLDQWLGDMRREGRIDGYDLLVLDPHVRSLMDVCGACERILRTPLTYSYLQFLRQSIVIYLMALPWALVHDVDFWTIPAVALIGYFLIGVELIAETVEEPFGTEVDDLPLDTLCQGIETSLREIAARASATQGRSPSAWS
jgi:ion channel-forming bestrophin family protein